MGTIPEAASNILLVEDDETHAILVMRSFEELTIPNELHWVSDGVEALDYLFRRGIYEDPGKSPVPDLILLDLRLPKLDGYEVLKAIKGFEVLSIIPVVVLSTSKNKSDMISVYRDHANGYLVKPMGFDNFQMMIKDMAIFWLRWNQKPWSERNELQ